MSAYCPGCQPFQQCVGTMPEQCVMPNPGSTLPMPETFLAGANRCMRGEFAGRVLAALMGRPVNLGDDLAVDRAIYLADLLIRRLDETPPGLHHRAGGQPACPKPSHAGESHEAP